MLRGDKLTDADAQLLLATEDSRHNSSSLGTRGRGVQMGAMTRLLTGDAQSRVSTQDSE